MKLHQAEFHFSCRVHSCSAPSWKFLPHVILREPWLMCALLEIMLSPYAALLLMHLDYCARPCLCEGEIFLPGSCGDRFTNVSRGSRYPLKQPFRLAEVFTPQTKKCWLPSFCHGNAEPLGIFDSSWRRAGFGLHGYKYSLSQAYPDPTFRALSHSAPGEVALPQALTPQGMLSSVTCKYLHCKHSFREKSRARN